MANEHLFRMEVFCTAKQLGDVIVVLSGRVVQVTTPQLVVNAKAHGGSVKSMSSGDLVEMFSQWIKENGLKEISTNDARKFLTSKGRSPNSASYLMTHTRNTGIIKHIGPGKKSLWAAVQPKPHIVASKKAATVKKSGASS